MPENDVLNALKSSIHEDIIREESGLVMMRGSLISHMESGSQIQEII